MRNASGDPFTIGCKVLKKNIKQLNHKGKMYNHYLGPYSIRGICSTGSYLLHDKYGHNLSKSVAANQLVLFHEKKRFKTNDKGEIVEVSESDAELSDVPMSNENIMCHVNNDTDTMSDSPTCTRAHVYHPTNPKTSTPVKSKQIIIASGQEVPVSSDESETIDVGVEQNPWGEILVSEIPIEIVDNLNESSLSAKVEHIDAGPVVYFTPLNDQDRINVGLKFNLVFKTETHKVVNFGIGLPCKSPPEITIESCGDGACLFNSMSILLSGRDTYSTLIRHVMCNYISNPIKLPALKMYLPAQYKTGKEYVVTTNMHNYCTWGTEVEIIALAQLSGFDIIVYTQQNNWV